MKYYSEKNFRKTEKYIDFCFSEVYTYIVRSIKTLTTKERRDIVGKKKEKKKPSEEKQLKRLVIVLTLLEIIEKITDIIAKF